MKKKSDYNGSEFFMDVVQSIFRWHFTHFDGKLSFLLLCELWFRETDFLFDTGNSYHRLLDYI
jgi:hypothetical protein